MKNRVTLYPQIKMAIGVRILLLLISVHWRLSAAHNLDLGNLRRLPRINLWAADKRPMNADKKKQNFKYLWLVLGLSEGPASAYFTKLQILEIHAFGW